MNPTDTPQLTADQVAQVYVDLGIDPSKRGCILLDTEQVVVSDIILYDDLYYADPVKHKWVQGISSETVPHVTLADGLMYSGLEQKKAVDALLTGWTPEALTIAEISFFPSNDPEEKYITLIAKLAITSNLLGANNRLKKLPHIDLHPDYVPHITLAYLNDTSDY